MEVHHHPHVEKKNLKEYFLEFLMIFLAVTLGFFAENVREYFSDKEKEKQYLRSFIADLTIDEQRLPILINAIEGQQIYPADSLPYLLKQASVKTSANTIYHSLRSMIRQQGIKVFVTDRTIEQVKNAGEMRLITDKNISDSLIDYYKGIDYAADLQASLLKMKEALTQNLRLILNAYDYAKMIDSRDHIIHPNETLHLRSVDEDAINRCLMSISEIKGLSITIRDLVRDILREAAGIKKMITDRYDLKKE